MSTQLMLGDEALAQGAIDAGLSGAYGYPGTPSTEIIEHLLRSPDVLGGQLLAHWTANEKTALESALGMSYAGKRAMATMKHVGLNVAADPFVNSAITGAHGGLLVVVADDPSMHSSQNEQDSRLYAELALVPCVEPADPQEAYNASGYAFALSESMGLPVLIRLTTRIAHARAVVTTGPRVAQNTRSVPADRERFVLLPANARRGYARLVARQIDLAAESERSPFQSAATAGDPAIGIIACGVAHGYLLDATDGKPAHPVLKVGFYPPPRRRLEELASRCVALLVLEEGYPFLESRLAGLLPRAAPEIRGRLSGHLPRTGELTADIVATALGMSDSLSHPASDIPCPRPPALCPGCPHGDTCRALAEALAEQRDAGRVFSDIGCYTLAALPPFRIIDTCVEMGGSITMARGAADAGLRPAVALLGDSTFTHSGMTGLLDCVNAGANVTVVIVDNKTVAMTGGQRSAAENRIDAICRGIGVPEDRIHRINPVPAHHEGNARLLREVMSADGTSVVIAERECLQTAKRHVMQRNKEVAR